MSWLRWAFIGGAVVLLGILLAILPTMPHWKEITLDDAESVRRLYCAVVILLLFAIAVKP